MRMLIVTAVEAERNAVTRLLPAHGDLLGLSPVSRAETTLGIITVAAVGAGVAEAAAGTAALLAAEHADLVVNAGIGGGFGLEPGTITVADAIVFADLGAQTSDGFSSASALGFGRTEYQPMPLPLPLPAVTGTILTVATVTGSAERAEELHRRYPQAVAEAMEGAGVAAAAAAFGSAFAELRAISNLVGPRDRDAWQIPRALDALAAVVAELAGTEWSPRR